jgi:hypothetical protein
MRPSPLLPSMIHAALYGKLNCLDSEDALTCAVFTRLRYLPPRVLGEWLATARSHADPAARAALRTSEPVIEFWPSVKDTLRGHGSVEPDIILRFDDEILVIEAKLWSSKSQTHDGLDQLARQWRGATDHYGAHVRVSALIYLTQHLEPPKAALAESAEALKADASSLWWLSWSSLAPILEQQLTTDDRVSRVVAADLLAYLTRVGLLRFRGWRLAPRWQRDACWIYHQPTLPRFRGWRLAPRRQRDARWTYRQRRITYWRASAISNRAWRYPR